MARAKKAAEAASGEAPQNEVAEPAQESKTAFVRMRKGDDTIDVHPLCVADHESIGWTQE